MKFRYLIILIVSLFSFNFSNTVKAQGTTIQVTGGYATVNSIFFPHGTFRLEGQDFIIQGSYDDGGCFVCYPCRSGGLLNLQLTMAPVSSRGTAVINRRTYSLYFEAYIRLSTPSVTIPRRPKYWFNRIGGDGYILPLTVSGIIRGCTTNPNPNGCASGYIFEYTLTGEGKASVYLNGWRVYPDDWLSPWEYIPMNLSYTFGSSTETSNDVAEPTLELKAEEINKDKR